MPRKPPRSSEERLARTQKSMTPGTLGGRVASAAPMSLDATRLDPRLRTQKRPLSGGGFDPNADPVVIGSGAFGSGSGVVAIGLSPDVEATDSVGIGHFAQVQPSLVNSVAIGPFAEIVGAPGDGDGVAIGHGPLVNGGTAIAIGSYPIANTDGVAIGNSASAGQGVGIGTNAASAQYCVSIGYNASSGSSFNTGAVMIGTNTAHTNSGGSGSSAWTNMIAVGYAAAAGNDSAVAVGPNSRADGASSSAFGAGATATKDHQIMLGTSAEFVEIPGNGPANGLVLTDTATSTRYLVQITSGALVLSTAP